MSIQNRPKARAISQIKNITKLLFENAIQKRKKDEILKIQIKLFFSRLDCKYRYE